MCVGSMRGSRGPQHLSALRCPKTAQFVLRVKKYSTPLSSTTSCTADIHGFMFFMPILSLLAAHRSRNRDLSDQMMFFHSPIIWHGDHYSFISLPVWQEWRQTWSSTNAVHRFIVNLISVSCFIFALFNLLALFQRCICFYPFQV